MDKKTIAYFVGGLVICVLTFAYSLQINASMMDKNRAKITPVVPGVKREDNLSDKEQDMINKIIDGFVQTK
jgi:hypothetical protein